MHLPWHSVGTVGVPLPGRRHYCPHKCWSSTQGMRWSRSSTGSPGPVMRSPSAGPSRSRSRCAKSRHCDRSICSLLRSVGTTQGQPTCVVAGTLVFPIPTPPAHLSHPCWLQQAGGQNVRGPDELEGGWSATDHGHMTGIDLLIGTSSANVFADAMVEPRLPRAGCRFSTTRSLQQDCWRTLAQGSP